MRDGREVLGDFRQQTVSFAFLVQGLLEEFNGLFFTETLSQRAGCAVAGHFVMLDALGGAKGFPICW